MDQTLVLLLCIISVCLFLFVPIYCICKSIDRIQYEYLNKIENLNENLNEN